LKDKLRHTDSLLREHESHQAHSLLKIEALAMWLNGKTTDEACESLEAYCESSPNQDIYLGLLLTRLSLQTTELDARRREHARILQELEMCRKKVAEFKSQVMNYFTFGQKEEILYLLRNTPLNIDWGFFGEKTECTWQIQRGNLIKICFFTFLRNPSKDSKA